MLKNYYKILEIENYSSFELVKNAYYKLIKQYHPDKVEEGDKIKAQEITIEIHEAYEFLKNPHNKAQYDKGLDLVIEFDNRSNVFKFAAEGNLNKLITEIKGGSSPSARSEDEESPLSIAFHSSHITIVKELLKHGAKLSLYDVARQDTMWSGHIGRAASTILLEKINKFLKDADSSINMEIKQQMFNAFTPSVAKSISQKEIFYSDTNEVIKILIKIDKNLVNTDEGTHSVLYKALQFDNPYNVRKYNQDVDYKELIDLLLKAGAHFNKHDFDTSDYGRFLIFGEIDYHLDLYKAALTQNNIDYLSTHDKLFDIILEKNIFLTEFLLKNSKKPMVIDQNKESPLSLACHNGLDDLFKILLSKGVKFSKYDFTRSDGNFGNDLVTQVKYILNHDTTYNKQLIIAALPEETSKNLTDYFLSHDNYTYKEAIALLLTAHPEYANSGENQISPLAKMLILDKILSAKLLLEHGGHFNKNDFDEFLNSKQEFLIIQIGKLLSKDADIYFGPSFYNMESWNIFDYIASYSTYKLSDNVNHVDLREKIVKQAFCDSSGHSLFEQITGLKENFAQDLLGQQSIQCPEEIVKLQGESATHTIAEDCIN